MLETEDIVIGIDGGGTHTRVMVSDLAGNVRSYVEKGSASLHKDLSAVENVKQAILEALAAAGREFHHVRGLAAGVAGYDKESDLEWVKSLTDIDGLTCPKWHFNDAVAAHYGALLTQPGIVAIAGTGSIILAVTEDGQYIRNYDFHHYAASAARFIAYDAAFEVLAGTADETDLELVQLMLNHWEVTTLSEFAVMAKKGFLEDRRERDRKFGQFTPAITEAAWRGSSLAKRVCDKAMHETKIGIELLSASFNDEAISVTFIGSVINSLYFKTELGKRLTFGNNKQFTIVPPHFSPVTGSILYAMNQLNMAIHDDIIANLEKNIHTRI